MSELLKAELTEKKTIEYHLLLSRVALKLISEEHMKVYYETSIKSYFYDRAGKRVKNLCGPL